MFFGLRVSASLAKIGISPQVVNVDYRIAMKRAAKNAGNSPQDVAVFIAAQLPLMHRAALQSAPIKAWIRDRKIDPKSEEMRDALGTLALWDLLSEPLRSHPPACSAGAEGEGEMTERVPKSPTNADLICQTMILTAQYLGAKSPREAAEIMQGRALSESEWQNHKSSWERNWNSR